MLFTAFYRCNTSREIGRFMRRIVKQNVILLLTRVVCGDTHKFMSKSSTAFRDGPLFSRV